MSITVTKAAESFLVHCRTAKVLSPHSLRAYEIDLQHAQAKLGVETIVSDVNRDLLRKYAGGMLRDEMLKEASVRRRIATVKQLFKWLEREEYLDVNPFHRLDMTIRIPRRLPRALTPSEIRQLIEAADREMGIKKTHAAMLMHFAIVALFVSGLRVGELTGVRVQDVDAVEGTIRVRGKGNRERQVYLLGGDAKVILERYLEGKKLISTDCDFLLVTEKGGAISPQYIRRSLSKLAKRAGIARHVTPHMLRHTAATQLVEAGVDIRFVQKLLGHASIATTQIYTQVSDSSLRATLVQANTLGRLAGKVGR
jgi:integrase/recombinase XerD